MNKILKTSSIIFLVVLILLNSSITYAALYTSFKNYYSVNFSGDYAGFELIYSRNNTEEDMGDVLLIDYFMDVDRYFNSGDMQSIMISISRNNGKTDFTSQEMTSLRNNISNQNAGATILDCQQFLYKNTSRGVKIAYIVKDNQTNDGVYVNTYTFRSDNYLIEFTYMFDLEVVLAEDLRVSSWNYSTFDNFVNTINVNDTFSKFAKLSFKDVVKTDWFYDNVKYVYEKGMITGYNSTTFAPHDNLSRAMVVTILYRLEGKPNVSTLKNNFTDVASGTWYTDAVKWANAKGIVTGYGGTKKFGPSDDITRQDFAVMLMRYAKYKNKYQEPTNNLNAFADKGKVSSYAQTAVKWVIGKGIITGKTSNGKKYIDPLANTQRCEAAAMLQRFCENVK